MGQTAAETAREIAALRHETERLLDELEGRVHRTLEVRNQVTASVRANPIVLAAGAVVAGLVVLALWYRSWKRARERRKPLNRLRRGVRAFGREAGVRARRAGLALEGHYDEEEPVQGKRTQEPGMVAKLGGAVASAATLALVDRFVRWLSTQRRTTTVQEENTGA